MDALTATDFAAILFPLLNGLRVLAYVPQILKIAHDRHGAEAISCTTWLVFALSHLSTVFYAALVVSDGWMAWIFVANLIACIAVLGLTALKRSLLTRSVRREAPPAGGGRGTGIQHSPL